MEHFSDSLIRMITEYCSKEVYILYLCLYSNSTHRIVGIFDSEKEARKRAEDTEISMYDCTYKHPSFLGFVDWKEDSKKNSRGDYDDYKYIVKKEINGKIELPFFPGCHSFYKNECACEIDRIFSKDSLLSKSVQNNSG